jgi:AAA+ superfamily predicted ATPase
MSDRELRELRKFRDKSVKKIGGSPRSPDAPASVGQTTSQSVKLHDDMFNSRMWANSGDAFFPCESTTERLPAGHYIVQESPNRGVFLQKQTINVDNLIRLPDSASDRIIKHIQEFWTMEDHFKKYGFLWKRGILLWGPPGSGKTATLQLLMQNIYEQNGISVQIHNPYLDVVGLQILRKIEPKRTLIVIMEDLDAIVQNHGESVLLSLLDGEYQISNIVFVATTNYPEKLDPRFVDRPSRFDYLTLIDMPSAEARHIFLKNKSKKLADNASLLKKWVDDTDGFSVAHIKELVISVEVFKSDYDFTLARLKLMSDNEPHSKDYRHKAMGFLS